MAVANAVRVVHVRGVSSRARPLFVEWHKHRGLWRYFRKFEAPRRGLFGRMAICSCGNSMVKYSHWDGRDSAADREAALIGNRHPMGNTTLEIRIDLFDHGEAVLLEHFDFVRVVSQQAQAADANVAQALSANAVIAQVEFMPSDLRCHVKWRRWLQWRLAPRVQADGSCLWL